MKRLVFLSVLTAVAQVTSTVLADGKAACLDASSKGQRLKDVHKLVEARDQLRVCAAAGCPAVVQADCATWLAEIEKALPGVVPTAKNSAGADLVDVKVSLDGQPLVSKLDGQAIPVDAGLHRFHFEGAEGSADQQVLIVEGEKNKRIAVVLTPGAAASAPAASAAPAASDVDEPAPDTSSSRPWRTVGWVGVGVGVAGLGVGTVFGIIALGDKNNAGCNANNVCKPGTTDAIKSTSLVSDIGWIAGGVLLASGAALVLFTPDGGHAAESAVRVAPVLTAGGGGVIAGGSW